MKGYILTLLASAVTVTISSLLLPEGSVKKYAHLVSSIVISFAVIAPFNSLFDVSEIFEFDDISAYEMTREEAEEIYSENLKSELKKTIEEGLLLYGKAYVEIGDDLEIVSIEIHPKTAIDEEKVLEIKEMYQPERFEIIYD